MLGQILNNFMFQSFISLVQIDLIVSIADKIASLLVRGFLESGTFSIFVVI